MIHILVTGSNGLVGSKIIERGLLYPEIQLTATSKGRNKSNSLDVRFENMDIGDSASVEYVIGKYRPDVVINAAVIGQVDYCESHREECWDVNVIGLENLIQACRKQRIHLTHISTDFIFDGTKNQYREEDEGNPVNFYGKSKLEAETMLRQSGIPHSIIRTILVYGVLRNHHRSNIITWVYDSLTAGKAIKVVDDQSRCPTLVDDLADTILFAAKEKKEGIYHVCGNENLSVYEFARKIASHFQLDNRLISPISSQSLQQIGKRPPKTCFHQQKTLRELDYHPHSIREGLEICRDMLERKVE